MNRKAARHKNKRDPYHSFLESLNGKIVTIYRGGPESKTGILLDVSSDFITLYAQDKKGHSVVYYQADHVKSISEDSKSNSRQILKKKSDEIEFLKADDFVELLRGLVNESVKINQGGPESKHGTLLSVSGDHLVLYTDDDGIVYYNIVHVKSITKHMGKAQNFQNSEFEMAEDFQALFRSMAHKWVSINRGGPEAMEGVLVENVGGHYTLVKNEEVLRIHPYHIRSISSGPKGSLKDNNQDNNQDDNKNDDQNNNQDDNNQDDNKQDDNKKDDNKQDDNKKDDNKQDDNKKDNKQDDNKKDDNKKDDNKKDNKQDDNKKKDKQDKKHDDQDKKKHEDSVSEKRSHENHQTSNKRAQNHGTVVKSIDYIWKG